MNHIEQGWPDFFSQGPNLKILFLARASKFENLHSRKFLRLFVPFLIIFDAYLEKNQPFFDNFSINLIFCNVFFSNEKKV